VIVDSKKVAKTLFFKNVLRIYETFLLNRNFSEISHAFIRLKNFKKAIRNRRIEQISEGESRLLVRSLNQYWSGVDGSLSVSGITAYLLQIPMLREKVNIINKRTKKIEKILKEMPEIIKTDITSVKQLELSVTKLQQMKISIVTHEGENPFSELTNFKNKKSSFHIWIDQRKPEVIVNGEIQDKMTESLQARRLLILLLFRHDNLVSHKEIFEALDEEGRKLDSGKIRATIRSFKSNVNQMICNLNERTHRLFENNIVTLKRQGYRFDLHGMKFCVINKQI
jgi:DNA-binding winged helix-turn-helix (wHTH) protein